MIRVFEAFSGYGSQALGLNRLKETHPEFAYEVVGISEIDRYALQAYKSLHGHCPNYGDISKIDWSSVPNFDLFTYSSPCQDFSLAGKQKGGTQGSGTRSSLLWECYRAIEAKKPRFLLFENVAALRTCKFIRLFNDWQCRLEQLGYTNYANVLNAKHFGVPQSRERLFCISVLKKGFEFPKGNSVTKKMLDVLDVKVDDKYYVQMTPQRAEQFRLNYGKHARTDMWQVSSIQKQRLKFTVTFEGRVFSPLGIAPTVLRCKDRLLVLCDDGRIRYLTEKETFRLMGLRDGEIDAIQSTDISSTQQYKMAGNSIVVNVLSALFEQMFYPKKIKEINLFY